MKRLLVYVLLLLIMPVCAAAQWDFKVDTTINGYRFSSAIDTSDFSSAFTITKGRKTIYKDMYYEYVYSVRWESLKKGGESYLFIEFYSGGAHCCTSLIIGKIEGDKFVKLDSAFYGNSGFVMEDLDKDGVTEIVSGNDMFAYAFTNYAETRFPLRVEEFDGRRLKSITHRFKDLIMFELSEFRNDLEEFVKGGFECPADVNEDTFNTDAGSVKTLLAAIVADYHSLGEVHKGYELVDKVYKCIDREKFKKILQEDFKLK